MNQMDDMIDATEVVSILGWTPDRVYRFTRESRIPHVKKFGRNYIYSRTQIESYRDAQKEVTTT